MILIIESSGKNCSVAVAENNNCLFLKEELSTEGYIHTEKLHTFIENALDFVQTHNGELKAIAVSEGPGSYTGLRYGVSAAKGLCVAQKLPLIAVNPFRAMLECLKSQHNLSSVNIAMMDARRQEVFQQCFDEEGNEISSVEAKIIDTETKYDKALWFGDGADKLKNLNLIPEHISFEKNILPSAKFHVLEACKKYEEKSFEDVAYFVPFYLKDFKTTVAKPKFSIKGVGKSV